MKTLVVNVLVCFGLLIVPAANADDTKVVPESRAQIMYSFAPLVKKVVPSVVNIYTHSRVQVQDKSPFDNDPFFHQFMGQGFGGRTHEQVTSSLGSGVIVQPDGMIVTSYHVVKDAQEIKVALSDKREFEAKVITRDPQSDLAFLQLIFEQSKPIQFPYLEMRDSDKLEVGDLVLAVGNPFGVGQTVTSGIISALARKANGVSDYEFFIQTDAAINPGNSGGALVDMDGKLIGINTAIYSTSGGSTGIGFAIPANMVKSLMQGKVEDGHVVRPWLGIGVQPVTAEMSESLGLSAAQGVIIKKIIAGSAAEKAGFKVGDVILAINGYNIGSEQDMTYRIALGKIGEPSEFQIMREGKPTAISVVLQAPPESPRDERTLSGKSPLAGLKVANLSPALALQLGFDNPDITGVVVMEAGENNALGISISFAPGDIIMEVNGNKIISTQQLDALVKTPTRSWQINYKRGGNILTLTVKM